MSECKKLSRLIRAHQAMESGCVINEAFSSSWSQYNKMDFNSYSHASISNDNYSHSFYDKKDTDDELQSLDWLIARPCIPCLPPLDQEDLEPWPPRNDYSQGLMNSSFGGIENETHSSLSIDNSEHGLYNDVAGSGNFPRSSSNLYHPLPGNYYHVSDRHSEKPALSYSNLIFLAILSSPRQAMTVNQMYQWCERTFPYYQDKTNGWKNSLRHNLSLNKGFHKLPKANGESGRGALWVIDPNQYQMMLEAVRKNPICLEILRQQQDQLHMVEVSGHIGSDLLLPLDGSNSSGTMASFLASSGATNSSISSRWDKNQRERCLLPNGWADISEASAHLAWRVVPQNIGPMALGAFISEEDEADFRAMVERMHLTKEQIMAKEKLTVEEMEDIPSIDEYPQLFKEMVNIKVGKKDGRKRRRKAGGGCVSFRAAPSIDHHYAIHQMLLSPQANRMPCLLERTHDDMEWYGSEPQETQLIQESIHNQEKRSINSSPVSPRRTIVSPNSQSHNSSLHHTSVRTPTSITDKATKRRVRSSPTDVENKKRSKVNLKMDSVENSSSSLTPISPVTAARILLDVAKWQTTNQVTSIKSEKLDECSQLSPPQILNICSTTTQTPNVAENAEEVNENVSNYTKIAESSISRSRRKAPICQRNLPPDIEETHNLSHFVDTKVPSIMKDGSLNYVISSSQRQTMRPISESIVDITKNDSGVSVDESNGMEEMAMDLRVKPVIESDTSRQTELPDIIATSQPPRNEAISSQRHSPRKVKEEILSSTSPVPLSSDSIKVTSHLSSVLSKSRKRLRLNE